MGLCESLCGSCLRRRQYQALEGTEDEDSRGGALGALPSGAPAHPSGGLPGGAGGAKGGAPLGVHPPAVNGVRGAPGGLPQAPAAGRGGRAAAAALGGGAPGGVSGAYGTGAAAGYPSQQLNGRGAGPRAHYVYQGGPGGGAAQGVAGAPAGGPYARATAGGRGPAAAVVGGAYASGAATAYPGRAGPPPGAVPAATYMRGPAPGGAGRGGISGVAGAAAGNGVGALVAGAPRGAGTAAAAGGVGGALASAGVTAGGVGGAVMSGGGGGGGGTGGGGGGGSFNLKYDIKEVLGVGSTSTCYRCVDRGSGTSYACKVIDKRTVEQKFKGLLEQFHNEIAVLRQLRHPNIIGLRDAYESDARIHMVLELMEGGELFDFVVDRGTLSEAEASRMLRGVASAVAYMHGLGIIHRDLKPENLLISKDAQTVKIIDFGLCKALASGDQAKSFLGTRGYLAPEMLQRESYSKSVDVWALGVICFVLLCGCLPFDDDSSRINKKSALAKFVLRFPRWAQNLSPQAKDLLGGLLDVNPTTRLTAQAALDHPWMSGAAAGATAMLESPKALRQALPRIRSPQATQAMRYAAPAGGGGGGGVGGGSGATGFAAAAAAALGGGGGAASTNQRLADFEEQRGEYMDDSKLRKNSI